MKIIRLFLIAIGVSVVAMTTCQAAAAMASPPDPLVIQTDKGAVKGMVKSSVRMFQNIPYAAPPTNQLRWQPPQPTTSWTGVRDATAPGNACLQGAPGSVDSTTTQSEDCLYLNVTTKLQAKKTDKKPVIVWLHGGGFTTGTAAAYDPTRMVDQGDVVVVTVNYRLGMFGAYAQADLPGAGDFGLLDQQAALRWVQQNIKNFGGDPQNVTLAGESAGAISVCGQLTSPTARDLFDRAVMESGSCDTNISLTVPGTDKLTPLGTKLFESLQTTKQKSQAAAGQLGCGELSPKDTLDCLRKKDGETIQKYMTLVTTPAYGTPALPEAPMQALERGHELHVPILSGGNQNESRLVIMSDALTGYPITAERYEDVLQQAFGAKASIVRQLYSPEIYKDDNGVPSPALALAALQTDHDFICPQYATNEKLSWRMPVYSFDFADSHALSAIPSFIPGFPMGASHTSELYDLFDLTPPPVNADGTPQQQTPEQWQLAATMIGYWTSFARYGTPNNFPQPHWTPYLPFSHQTINLAPGAGNITMINGNAQHNCGFWQRVGL